MGNHAVGLAIGLAAQEAVRCRNSDESALDILDRICSQYAGCDAEFESQNPDKKDEVHPDFFDFRDPHPKAALGMLMLEAFSPNGVADIVKYEPMLTGEEGEEAACDLWWEQVRNKFRDRYDFG